MATTVEHPKPVTLPLQRSVRAWFRGRYAPTVRNGVVSLIDQAIVSGASFTTTVIVGRVCGADGLGVYSLAFTLLVLITSAQQSLLLTPYTIFVNRRKKDNLPEYDGSLLIQQGLLTCLMVLGLAVGGLCLSLVMGPTGLSPLLWVLAGVIPLLMLREFIRRISFAHLNMLTALFVDLVVATIQIGLLIGLAQSGILSPMTAYAVVGAACGIASLGWFALSRRRFIFRWANVGKEIKHNWSLGRWIFAGRMTATMHTYMIHWLIAVFLTPTAIGVYAACLTIALVCNPFLFGIYNLLAPKTAEAYATNGHRGAAKVVWIATGLLMVVMIPFALAVAFLGEMAVHLLYDGGEYAGQGSLLTILGLAMLAGAIGGPSEHGLSVIERPDVNFLAGMCGLVTALTVAVIAMMQWGIVGAAWGLFSGHLAGSIVTCVGFAYLSRRDQSRRAIA